MLDSQLLEVLRLVSANSLAGELSILQEPARGESHAITRRAAL